MTDDRGASESQRGRPSRRRLLQVTGFAVASGLAGCGSSTDGSPTDTGNPSGTATPGGTPTDREAIAEVQPANCEGEEITESITSDTTWEAGECPKIVLSGIGPTPIMKGATLTIKPGVEIVGNGLIRVEDGATLRAEGEYARPVWFRGEPREMGSWGGILVENGGTAILDRVAVHDAGGGEGAAITAQNDSEVSLTNSVVRRTAGTGLSLDENATLSEFSNNEFSGNESEPVRVNPTHVSALDSETIYSGNNGTDAVYVRNGILTEDATWAAAGVPYRVGVFTVEAALSLDPGAAVASRGATIRVENGGSLTAEGESDAPVRIEGATEERGFWSGIVARGQTAVTLDNAVVAHGGGGEPANLTLRGSSSATVTNCTIRDADGYGINVDEGATLTSSNNTFENNTEGAIGGGGA